jgi:methylmalonyl-CoA/ethylmalonyl-CoA epimerase
LTIAAQRVTMVTNKAEISREPPMSSAPTVVSLNQIGQIAVTVYDLDRAVRFYHGTLGMKLLFHLPQMAFFDCGGVRLMLAPPEKPEFDHPASVIYYKVADLPATHAELDSRDVKFEAAPHLIAKMADHDLWMAFLRDSEGNLVGLMSEVAT